MVMGKKNKLFAFRHVNRKCRRIEDAIVANEAWYSGTQYMTFEMLEEYMMRGMALMQKLLHYSARHAHRYEAYEQQVLETVRDNAGAIGMPMERWTNDHGEWQR
jgi:hypothetical protein